MPVLDSYALLGYPLGHSLSPLLHRLISERCGFSCRYELEACPPAALTKRWPELQRCYGGLNVTLPYKQEIFHKLEEKSAEALYVGAVNTVFQGKGHNSDYLALRSLLPNCAGKNVLLLGYGGVAAAMAALVLAEGCKKLWVVGRDFAKARYFVNFLEEKQTGAELAALDYAALAEVLEEADFSCEFLLQGTSAGMWPRCAELPLPETLLKKLFLRVTPFVFESIYNPAATRFLLQARSAGLHALGGLRMLFRQGLEARKIWRPDLDFGAAAAAEAEICGEMARALRRLYPPKILLTGFMGAGKSHLLYELSKRLNAPDMKATEGMREWLSLDLDTCVEARVGRSIAEIFAADSEAAFRALEADCFRELLQAPGKAGLLLATGGGTLLQPGALELAREAGAFIVFLDVSLESALRRLLGGRGRPLLQADDRETFARRTRELYNSRRPQYQALADFTLDADAAPEQMVQELIVALGW